MKNIDNNLNDTDKLLEFNVDFSVLSRMLKTIKEKGESTSQEVSELRQLISNNNNEKYVIDEMLRENSEKTSVIYDLI